MRYDKSNRGGRADALEVDEGLASGAGRTGILQGGASGTGSQGGAGKTGSQRGIGADSGLSSGAGADSGLVVMTVWSMEDLDAGLA